MLSWWHDVLLIGGCFILVSGLSGRWRRGEKPFFASSNATFTIVVGPRCFQNLLEIL